MRLGAWIIHLIIKKEGEERGVGKRECNVLTINNNNNKKPVLGLLRSKQFNSCVYVNRMHVTA